MAVKGEEPKLWYQSGVLPIFTGVLWSYAGIRGRSAIDNIADSSRVYCERVGRKRLVYLIPDNIQLFLSSHSHASSDVETLRNMIENGEFNDIVKNPFRVLHISSLVMYNNVTSLQKIVKTLPPRLKISSACTIVTEDNASLFVRNGKDGRSNVESLVDGVRLHYEQFKKWQPNAGSL